MNSYPHRGGTGTDTGTDSNDGNDNADGADQCRRNIRRSYVMIKRHYALGYVSECKYKIKILNYQIYAAKSAADTHKKPFFESGATFQALIGYYFPALTL